MSSNLTKKTVTSTNWGMAKTLSQNGIAFISGMILARLLVPADFGLLAIAMIFVQFGNIFANFGISQAIIQKKKLTNEILSAGFLLSVSFGFILFGIIWLAAPFIADFFNEPRSMEVTRALAVIFILNGIIGVNRGFMMRHFRYKMIFYIEIAGYAFGFGATGIVMAALGFGVWSLVWGVIIQHIIIALGYIIFVRLKFWNVHKANGYRSLLQYGGGVSLIGLFNYIAMNIDYLIIGRLLNATQLGFYSKAFGLMQIPARNISYTLGGVSMSTFSSVQDDIPRLKKGFYKAMNLIFLVGGPAMVVMVLSAEYLIIGFYGNQWHGAVAAFQILSISIVFKVFFGISGSLAKATNNVYGETIRQFIFAALVGGLSYGLIGYGIEGVAWAVTIAAFVFFILITQLSLRIVQGTWLEIIKEFKGGFWIAVGVAIANYASILLIEFSIPDSAVPLQLLGILIITGLAFVILFFKLPDSMLGPGRTWVVTTYMNKLPLRIRSVIQKFI